jgi:hypothetical protein
VCRRVLNEVGTTAHWSQAAAAVGSGDDRSIRRSPRQTPSRAFMTWDSHSDGLPEVVRSVDRGERGRLAMVIAAYERGAEADAEQLAEALPPATVFPL